MTAGEESFAHLIDQLTQKLHPAYYKSAVIEALYAFTQFCINNPGARFSNPISFSDVLEQAAKAYALEKFKENVPNAIHYLELFMQQSPHVLNLYITLIYSSIKDQAET